MTKSEITSMIMESSKIELEELLIELYEVNQFTRKFLESHFSPEQEIILLNECKQYVDDFYEQHQSLTDDKINHVIEYTERSMNIFVKPVNKIDLLLYFIHISIAFITDSENDDGSFQDVLIDLFDTAIHLILEHELQDDFGELSERINHASQKIGWRFGDEIDRIYQDLR